MTYINNKVKNKINSDICIRELFDNLFFFCYTKRLEHQRGRDKDKQLKNIFFYSSKMNADCVHFTEIKKSFVSDNYVCPEEVCYEYEHQMKYSRTLLPPEYRCVT